MYIQTCNSVYQRPVDSRQNLFMDPTYERLQQAAHELRGWKTQAEIARGLTRNGYDVAEQVLNNWRTRGVSKEGQLNASFIIGCRPHWLKTGEGPMSDLLAAANFEPAPPTDDEFALVPQLDMELSCGDGRFVDHVVVKGGLAFKRSSLRDFGIKENDARIIYAAGSSMAPTIQDGCVVLLNLAQREPRDGKVFAICGPDGDVILKRLVWDFSPSAGTQAWIIRSDNPDKTRFPDKLLPPDDRTMIAGQAIWNDNRL